MDVRGGRAAQAAEAHMRRAGRAGKRTAAATNNPTSAPAAKKQKPAAKPKPKPPKAKATATATATGKGKAAGVHDVDVEDVAESDEPDESEDGDADASEPDPEAAQEERLFTMGLLDACPRCGLDLAAQLGRHSQEESTRHLQVGRCRSVVVGRPL
jgi:hypothetical protein